LHQQAAQRCGSPEGRRGSPVLATLGRLVPAVIVAVLLTFPFLPLSFMPMTGEDHPG
jgi:hypothetical protein